MSKPPPPPPSPPCGHELHLPSFPLPLHPPPPLIEATRCPASSRGAGDEVCGRESQPCPQRFSLFIAVMGSLLVWAGSGKRGFPAKQLVPGGQAASLGAPGPRERLPSNSKGRTPPLRRQDAAFHPAAGSARGPCLLAWLSTPTKATYSGSVSPASRPLGTRMRTERPLKASRENACSQAGRRAGRSRKPPWG